MCSKTSFSRKVSPAAMLPKERLRYLFACSDIVSKECSTLTDYFIGEDSLIEVDVPGCDPKETHLKATDLARLSARGIIKWILYLHSHGWSLNGEISSDDFFLSPCGNFKMKKDGMKFLRRCKVKRRKRDMEAIAQVIHNDIFKGSGDIPYDFQHLLWLLRHYRRRYGNLVHNHPSLLRESSNLFLVQKLYAMLHQFCKAKYNRIISKIPYCKIDQDHWKLRCQHNQFLMKILEPNGPLSAQVQSPPTVPGSTQPFLALQIDSIGPDYENNGDGLLKLLLESYWNIHRHSIGEVEVKKGQKKKVKLFEHDQVQHMFSVAFPQAICRFQKAMHAEEEMPHDIPDIFGPSLGDFCRNA